MTVWRDVERLRRSLAHGESSAEGLSARAAAEIDCVSSWVQPSPSKRLGVASLCSGCHRRELASRGYEVEPFDPGDPGDLPNPTKLAGLRQDPESSRPGGLAPENRLDAIVVFGRTLLPFWEVEELHRLRLRTVRERLPDDGRLIFGDPETLGRADLELARLAEAFAAFPQVRHELRVLGRRGRFTHYSAAQARTLLELCGFKLEGIRNGFTDRQPYEDHRPGIVFLCRRA